MNETLYILKLNVNKERCAAAAKYGMIWQFQGEDFHFWIQREDKAPCVLC